MQQSKQFRSILSCDWRKRSPMRAAGRAIIEERNGADRTSEGPKVSVERKFGVHERKLEVTATLLAALQVQPTGTKGGKATDDVRSAVTGFEERRDRCQRSESSHTGASLDFSDVPLSNSTSDWAGCSKRCLLRLTPTSRQHNRIGPVMAPSSPK